MLQLEHHTGRRELVCSSRAKPRGFWQSLWMTYCLAIKVREGIAFAGDTRSNAGVDYVTSYRKLHTFKTASDRVVVLLSAGSLATTQEVCHRLRRDLQRSGVRNLNSAAHLFEVAAYVGSVSQAVQRKHQTALNTSGVNGESTFILGGQVKGETSGLFLIYPQGNFIEASDDTPYLQIGESKYGKPVLDRFAHLNLTLRQAARLTVLSLDATVKSNVTVGTPFDIGVYREGSLLAPVTARLEEDDEYLKLVGDTWSESLETCFKGLPDFEWPAIAQGPVRPLE